jgi:choline transporter-like protein 2/4/5
MPGSGVSPEEKKGYDGPPDSRKCTDVLCLILFMLFCGAGVGIGIFAIQNGNPNSLIYGKDEFGNVCGSANSERTAKCSAKECMWADGKTKQGEKWAHWLPEDSDQSLAINNIEAKFTAYPRIQDDLLEGKTVNQFFGVCMTECPKKAAWICSKYGKAAVADALSMKTFPEDVNDVKNCPGCAAKLRECQESENPITPRSLHVWKSTECRNMLQSCFFSPMPTVSTMFRCFPKYNKTVVYGCDDNNDGEPDNGWHKKKTDVTADNKCGTLLESSTTQQSASGNEIFEQLNQAMAKLGRMVNDLQAGMVPILVCGIAVSMVFGFLWLILLRHCAKVFVWLTIVLIVVLQTTLTVFFYHKAGMVTMEAPVTEDSQSEQMMPPEIENAQGDSDFFRWCGIGMTALLIVSLVTIATAVKKINVASQIIAEASSAVGQMKAMMLYPMLPVLLISIVFVWFLYVGKFRQLFSPLVAMIFARVLFVFVCLFVMVLDAGCPLFDPIAETNHAHTPLLNNHNSCMPLLYRIDFLR